MHLSSRWGVPSWVIESLPISEFNKQKVFWSINKWGIEDHLLALLSSQLISHRTKEKPLDVNIIKDIVIRESNYKPIIIETTENLTRNIFNTLAPIMESSDVRVDT